MKSTKEIAHAAAIQYVSDEPAPQILASGTGTAADSILKVANENNVTIIKDDILAGVLSQCPAGSYIPEQTYAAVAAILVFADMLGKKDL